MNKEKIKKLRDFYAGQITISTCYDAAQKAVNGLKKERKAAVQQVYLHGMLQGIEDILSLEGEQ